MEEEEALQTSKADGEIKGVQGEVGINAKVLTVCRDHLQEGELSEMLLVSFFYPIYTRTYIYVYIFIYASAGEVSRRGTVAV